MSWENLVAILFSSGFGSVIAQILFSAYQNCRLKKSDATFMAMRLAATLDSYAAACWEFIVNNSNIATDIEKQYFDLNCNLPASPNLPDDTKGWKALDQVLANRCLNFPNQISACQMDIHENLKFCPESIAETLEKNAAKLGLDATKIAHELRSEYNIQESKKDWDYALHFRKSIEQIDLARKEAADSLRNSK